MHGIEQNEQGVIIIDPQSFMYQLTINAPKEKGYNHEHIVEIIRDNFKTIKYFCMADEEGSMYHTHVFVVFASRVRFSMVKRYFPEAHIEKCRGSVSDNVNYIKKSGKWELDELNMGALTGFDIVSTDKKVVAECFATVTAFNNQKIKKDSKKLMQLNDDVKRYIYFYSREDSQDRIVAFTEKYGSIKYIRIEAF